MTPEIANLILSSNETTREERLQAQKYLKSYQLPGANPDDLDFGRKVIIQDSGRFLRGVEDLPSQLNDPILE